MQRAAFAGEIILILDEQQSCRFWINWHSVPLQIQESPGYCFTKTRMAMPLLLASFPPGHLFPITGLECCATASRRKAQPAAASAKPPRTHSTSAVAASRMWVGTLMVL